MSWDAYHRRKTLMQEILVIADARRDVAIERLLDMVDGARDVFPTAADLLFDLQLHWTSTLSARLDALVGEGAETPEIGVIGAWVETAGVLPGTRRLLDAARHEPALATAFTKEDVLLARAAGVPVMSPDLAARGRSIIDSARGQSVLPEIAPAPVKPANLIDWLRNRLVPQLGPA